MSCGRRFRRGRRGRLPKPVIIPNPAKFQNFMPHPKVTGNAITIEPAELEAMRLVDLEDLSQEQAGVKMGVSRGTIWRLVKSARKKVIQALTESRPLVVSNNEKK